jgi:hypothetical protein
MPSIKNLFRSFGFGHGSDKQKLTVNVDGFSLIPAFFNIIAYKHRHWCQKPYHIGRERNECKMQQHL